MSDFTPNTAQVRQATVGNFAMRHDEFDQWLRVHDAETRAAALTDAADNFLWAGEDEDYAAFMGWLRDRATWERQGRQP